ncbi:MFS transporter [Leucobacter luti]|uniref:Na+/melibiose symporter-like transporter n=1 Tax=Leucobacter luti TaxID=340320 RepID=A0A4R6S1Q6_9MICO|nr:MFS transporter [Leucobacter luti]MCW2289099.1 MFS family permease [Leucobacter luti]QYM75054.1 MFS transporter [Leucobacter luti]TCK35502.1 Na+/melibiose symporter-like transporter [Leucobacter luti]TDP93461.1 Na+/melibiose symporter-like transporter [Leucobacter luti]
MSEITNTTSIEYDATQQLDVKDANKVALGALIGTALEWYDFFLFSAAAALVFNVQYFASENATAAALASFATFGVGLAARPIGGIIFGRMGDRVGRRKVLMITIVGIGIVTGLIGMLPTYAAIGIAAPILLVLLRVVQGLFVGGEWSGAMTIVVENAPLHLRAKYAAIPQIGSPIGTILSSGGFFIMTLVFSQENFDAWGWRIPFLIAIPLLLVAVYIRSKLEESPVFRQLEESGEVVKSPVLTTFKDSWRQIIVGMAAALLGVGGFYLVTAFCVWYGVNVLGYSPSLMLLGSMVAAAVEIAALLWGGSLGAKYGASRVIIWGGVASAVVAVPAFLLLSSGIPVLVVIAMTLAVCTLSLPYAASGTVLTGLFPAKTRYTGVGLAQNVAGMLSGFIPLAATGLVAMAANHWWPAAAMLVFLSLFTAVAGVLAPRLSVKLPGFKH